MSHHKALLTFGILILLAIGAQSQTPLPPQSLIDYQPVSCIRSDEVPLLQMNVKAEGDLRAYFRRTSTTDWCSVEGINQGPLSSVRLPKFEEGDEIEYFFLLLDGKRVVSRSPQIYRARATRRCETLIARNMVLIPMSCETNGNNSMPASMGAGYAVKSSVPEDATPFEPTQ
jgi:hypothetical protein